MENTVIHTGAALYNFSVSLQNSRLEMTLKATNEAGIQIFKTLLTDESLSEKLYRAAPVCVTVFSIYLLF